MYDWPEHFPEDCPPYDAKPIDGSVYRFINKNKPATKDFKSYYELGINGDDECKRRGLSVYKTEDGCKIAMGAVPALRKKKIVAASLQEEHGMIAHTPSKTNKNHYTWWVNGLSEELLKLFIVVEISEVLNA